MVIPSSRGVPTGRARGRLFFATLTLPIERESTVLGKVVLVRAPYPSPSDMSNDPGNFRKRVEHSQKVGSEFGGSPPFWTSNRPTEPGHCWI